MITQRAISGLDRLLTRCLENSLKTESHSAWEIVPSAEPGDQGPPHFILLTVSSYDFQLLITLHFSVDAATRGYVADGIRIAPGDLELSRYHDFISEIGNAFCGGLKRELGEYFSHLGMSTPNLLARESLKYLRTWPIDHESHFVARGGDGVEFYGGLYVCTDGEFDFQFKESAAAEQSSEMGELELF